MSDHQCGCGATLDPDTLSCRTCSTDSESDSGTGPGAEAERLPETGWYYLVDGRMGGPCDLDQLLSQVRSGELPADCSTWSPGMKEWTPVGEVRKRRESRSASNGSKNGARAGRGDAAMPSGGGVPQLVTGSRASEWLWQASSTSDADPSDDAAPEEGSAPANGGVDAARRPWEESAARNGSLVPSAAVLSWSARPDLAAIAAFPAFTDFQEISPGRLCRSSPPRPWHRWFARIVDTTLAALGLATALAIVAPRSGLFDSNVTAALLVLAVWLVTESIVLTIFGTTPGKALMNIELTRADGERLDLQQAFGRSLRVWALGMAGGLPIVNLVAMALAYRKLKSEGQTSWDRKGDFVIRHRRLGLGRIIGVTVFAVVYLALMILSALPA